MLENNEGMEVDKLRPIVLRSLDPSQLSLDINGIFFHFLHVEHGLEIVWIWIDDEGKITYRIWIQILRREGNWINIILEEGENDFIIHIKDLMRECAC